MPNTVDTRIHERPTMEYPVYGVAIGGRVSYIQRADTNYGSRWYEVIKNGNIWSAIGENAITGYDGTIGDNKKEAIEYLINKHINQTK